MLKVLLFNYEFPPLGGGAANALYFLCKEFSKPTMRDEIKIDVITSSVGEKRIEQFPPNITIHYLDIGKNNKDLHYQSSADLLSYSYQAYKYGKKLIQKSIIEKSPYTLQHSFFGIPCGFISLLLKKQFSLPYIVSLRGSDVPFYNTRFKWIDRFVFQYLSQYIWKQSKYTIANSQGLKNLALRTTPNQSIGIIGNGVDTQLFQSIPRTSPEVFTILYVGRLISRKNVDILIRGFAKFLSISKTKSTLHIVGDGNQKDELLQLVQTLKISDSVVFFGNTKHDQLPKIYRSSSVYILPSSNEGMSNTLLEAIASHLPVIVSNTGGTDELVGHNKNGIILERITPECVSKALFQIYENPVQKKSMSNFSSILSKKLSWETMAKKYWNYYLQIA